MKTPDFAKAANNGRQISSYGSLLSRMDKGEERVTRMAAEVVYHKAVNLRRDTHDPETWRRTGMPRRVSATDALHFARFSPFGDGKDVCLLCGMDNRLYYKVLDSTGDISTGDEPVFLAELPGRPLMAVTATEGVIRLLVAHQPDRYLTYDSKLNVTFHGAMPELPAIRIVASEYNTLYGTVPAVKLTGTSPGSSGSQLTAADNRLLTNALVGTYDLLRQQAKAMGYCAQPVMARYRLLDAAGNTIVVGPTVAVSAAEGVSATGSIVQVSADALQTLGEGRIEMGVYRPAVVAPAPLPAPWNRLVSKLVVEITDETEPLSRGIQAPHGVLRDPQSGQITVTSKLPGFANGTVTDKARFHRLGMEAMTAPMRIAAEFDTPFDGGIGEPAAIRAISPAGSLPLSPVPATSGDIAAMGRSWSAALEAGEVTVLCNPRREQSGGWSPDCFIASRDSGEGSVWRMAFSVRLPTPAGTVNVKKETGGLGNAPATLSPVLSFPSSEATSLTVSYLSPDGTVYEETFPLTPLPGTELACYISSGLERITLTKTADAYLPQGGDLPARLEAGVAEIYRTTDLGLRLDRRRICQGVIHAVRIAPRSGSGWDFSRLKLLISGESGTHIATLNAAGGFHSVAPVDNRPVRSPDAVCEAAGSNGAALLLYAGDDLVSISGQKAVTVKTSVTTLLSIPPADAIGWEGKNHEIWLSPNDGSGLLFRLTGAGEMIEARLPGINLPEEEGNPIPEEDCRFRFATDRGSLMISSPGGVHNLSDEEAVPTLEVSLRSRVHVNAAPRWLTVNIFASSLAGGLTLSGDRGTEIAEPLLRLSFSGAVNAPVTVRLASPRREWLETGCRFDASPDLAIRPFTFES